MNLYKGMLYTQGYLLDPRYADDRPGARGPDRRAADPQQPAAVPPPRQHQHRTATATATALASGRGCTAGACG